MGTKKVSIKEVLELFKKGVTRYKVEDKGYGSIEEIYGLTTTMCRELFSNPYIKGKKVILPKNTNDDGSTK